MSIESIQPALDSESDALFNPAFCALLLHRACAGYSARADQPMPVIYAFLILPSALHKPTRDELPGSTAALMWPWLREHPLLTMDFADRARRFRPYTAAAIRYGLTHSILVSSPGALAAGTIRRRPRTLHLTSDWLACHKAAGFFGKWFASNDADEATTLAQWGIRP